MFLEWIQIRILDYFICTDPDPSINRQKNEEKSGLLLFCDFFMLFYFRIMMKMYIQKGISIVGVLKLTGEKSRSRIH
jgi:hypothetical protein